MTRIGPIGPIGPIVLIALLMAASLSSGSQAAFDLVILNGRVIDPESRSDAIRNLGISNGTIKAVTTRNLSGRGDPPIRIRMKAA